MRILHVSTNEIEGGAARAANRLHRALRGEGTDSLMLVQSRSTGSPDVLSSSSKIGKALEVLRPSLDLLPLQLFDSAGLNHLNLAWFPDRLAAEVSRLSPQIIHLHWIAKGFIRIESLSRLHPPLIWTLHDMWAITGGCFHAGDCERFMRRCGSCPKLKGRRENDFTRSVWERKHSSWCTKPDALICPSRWMAERAAASSLFAGRDLRVIPNGLDLHRFQPYDRRLARQVLNVPQDRKLVLFSVLHGALNPYKGFEYLPEVSARLSQVYPDLEPVEWLLLGDINPRHVAEFPGQVHLLGRLSDDALIALAYSAADLFLCPSKIDTLPNTVMESLACGTPVAAFAVGGIPEMLDHQLTGWLSAPGDVEHLAAGIAWMLEDPLRHSELSRMARQRAEHDYDIRLQARRCLDLYAELLDRAAERP